MTYRASFFLELAVEVLYAITTIILFQVIYGAIHELAGWNYYEIMLLTGLDIVLTELFIGVMFALNVNNLPTSIKDGEIDQVLLKPINSQFALTIARLYLPSMITTLPGFYVIYQALMHMQIEFNILNIGSAMIILLCGLIIGYSIITIISSLAFIFANAKLLPRIGNNLVTFFDSKPHTIFTNIILKIFFFLIVPVVFIASIPVRTFVRGVELPYLFMALILAVIFFFGTTRIWKFMIMHYTSASS